MTRLNSIVAFAIVLVFSPLAILTAGGENDQEPASSEKIVRLTVKGMIFETEPPITFFGGQHGITLRKIVEVIRSAAKEPKTAALIVRLQSPVMGSL